MLFRSYQAKEIVNYRRTHGPLKSAEELRLLKDFPLLQEENGNLFMNTGFRIDVSYNEATDILTFSPNGDYVRVNPKPDHPISEQ